MKLHLLIVLLAAGACSQNYKVEEAFMKEQKSGKWSPGLTEKEQETLFRIANDSLDWGVAGAAGRFEFSGYDLTKKLKADAATFVTLKIDGMLRGCIGTLEPVEPLYLSVHHNALNAAFRDHRFRPVTQNERGMLELHISILSPITRLKSIGEFKIGEHGIILEKGRHRAVYLPEVALEQGWTVEETLASLSEKAGLPADAWKEGAQFSVFSSVVLGAR